MPAVSAAGNRLLCTFGCLRTASSHFHTTRWLLRTAIGCPVQQAGCPVQRAGCYFQHAGCSKLNTARPEVVAQYISHHS